MSKKILFPKDLPHPIREEYRRIRFAGTHNFRDMGGYSAADGRRVKWGVLYRSDSLSSLKRRQLNLFAQLKLWRVVDFRADFERNDNPDRLPPGMEDKLLPLPIFEANANLIKDVTRKVMYKKLDELDPDGMMHEANVQLATTFTPQYRQFFHELLQAQGQPILFHCTKGKDRTGFAAAVILRILGVPLDQILFDYLLTQRFSMKHHANGLMLLRLLRGKQAAMLVGTIAGVKPSYLQASFDSIDKTYGSFDKYVSQGLELTTEDITQLRNNLLEPAPTN